MKRYAIVYTSIKGQTQSIAERMKEVLEKEDAAQVDLVKLSDKKKDHPLPPETEKIIIGAPVYMGKYPKVLTSWVKKHRDEIISKPTGFFSVSLNAADRRSVARREDNQLIKKFINDTGFVPSYVATIIGALNYPSYGWLVKKIMVHKCAMAHGPVDTTQNYVLTDWEKVESFTRALITEKDDFAFSTTHRLNEEKTMYDFMPVFEQTWSQKKIIKKSPDEVYQALLHTRAREMTFANLLAWLRSFGKQSLPPSQETIVESAEKFGNIKLFQDSREIISGLVGRFWQPKFGIKKLVPTKFRDFNEPGYTKVITHFKVEPDLNSDFSVLTSEMRIHSTDALAAKKFKKYWGLLNPGIKLYMRSMLSAIQRQALEH